MTRTVQAQVRRDGWIRCFLLSPAQMSPYKGAKMFVMCPHRPAG